VGFTKKAVLFLLHCRSRGVDFTHCATIGRQVLYLNVGELRNAFNRNGRRLTTLETDSVFGGETSYAEALLSLLGANRIDSFDASSYERATVVTDFNNPLSDIYKAQYSAVIDGGSLEHVFNYPQGLKNAMEMVRPGGHLILITPTHSKSGHGFYQVSPELFHRTLCEANGYAPPEVLVSASRGDAWYRVVDPADVGGRIIINPKRYSDHLFVVARRLHSVPIFSTWPQQSDYASAWQRDVQPGKPEGFKNRLRAVRHRIPRPFLRAYSLLSAVGSKSTGLHRIDI
jgi:hypothetical protein